MSRVIDIHTHVFAEEIADRAITHLAGLTGLTPAYDGTVAGLISAMDDARVAVSVTQPVATKPTQVVRINDWSATIASDRIVPFGAMHPGFEEPAAEIARMASLGLKGFKMHTEYQEFQPDEPRLDPICEAAAEHGLIILFHAGLDAGVPTDNGRPERFARLLDRHPGLTVVLAHMGGWRLWDGVSEHLAGRPIYLDTSFASGYMTDDAFLGLVEQHGTDRVLFGSDGPWGYAAKELAWLRQLPFAEADLEAILGGNAAGLLEI